MNYKTLFRLLCLPLLSVLFVACTTYDYDAELNDNEQQRIRLHQEDQKIYQEITEAAQSLDYLIGEMTTRVRAELEAKEESLLQSIGESERLVNQYLTQKIGDADAYVDQLEQQSRQLIQQKEGEFNQACATLQEQKILLADQGYEANVQKMQEGIDLLNNFQALYDNAIAGMQSRITELEQMQQRLSTLEQQIQQTQAKRQQILNRVAQLQTKLQQSITTAIATTKTSEAHTAALRELQSSYSALVQAMKELEQAYTYDDSWVSDAENYAQTIQIAIDEMQSAISEANDLNTLLDQFEAGKADDILTQLEAIRDDIQDLADYDTSALDEASTVADELQNVCDAILAAASRCDDACTACEEAYDDCDWESWKS